MACRENQPANALRLGYDPLSRSKQTGPTTMPRDQRLIVLVLPKLPSTAWTRPSAMAACAQNRSLAREVNNIVSKIKSGITLRVKPSWYKLGECRIGSPVGKYGLDL